MLANTTPTKWKAMSAKVRLARTTSGEFEVMAEPFGRSSRSAGTRGGVEGGQRSGALVGSKCHDAGDNRSSEHQEQRDYHRPAGRAMTEISLCSKMNEIDEISDDRSG